MLHTNYHEKHKRQRQPACEPHDPPLGRALFKAQKELDRSHIWGVGVGVGVAAGVGVWVWVWVHVRACVIRRIILHVSSYSSSHSVQPASSHPLQPALLNSANCPGLARASGEGCSVGGDDSFCRDLVETPSVPRAAEAFFPISGVDHSSVRLNAERTSMLRTQVCSN